MLNKITKIFKAAFHFFGVIHKLRMKHFYTSVYFHFRDLDE